LKSLFWYVFVPFIVACLAWGLALIFTDVAEARPQWNYTSATWYGPGFYGKSMACGGTYTIRTRGIAHPTLPCGTKVTIRCTQSRLCAWRTVRVRVVDRCPSCFDLTARTALDMSGGQGPYTMNVRWARGWFYGQAIRL